MKNEPFFSFLLITYNQEHFVTEAFNSILAQTDRDFEIVICDDNSKDNTFAVCQQLVNEYKQNRGDIHIVLHRNETNKGIGGNFQQAYELSSGRWLLMAAGDDVSLPNRLEVVRDVINKCPNAFGINTGRYFVDENGCNPKYNFSKGYLLGADSVWHRDVFAKFPPLDKTVMSEDHILNLRAMLLGEMIQVNTPTINYRVSSMNYSIQRTSNILDAKNAALKKMSYTRDVLLFRIKDLNFWKKEHSETLMSQILEKNRRELAETDIKIASYKKFISICNKGFWGRILYVLRPTKEWLHSNMVYRLYNVLKMYDLVSDKPKRKTHSMEIVSKPNNEIVKLTSVDFLEDYMF